MAHYFFNFHDDTVTLDEEGRDCADVAAALALALRDARSIAADRVSQGRLDLSDRVEVVDESGNIVGAVTFADAVKVEGCASAA